MISPFLTPQNPFQLPVNSLPDRGSKPPCLIFSSSVCDPVYVLLLARGRAFTTGIPEGMLLQSFLVWDFFYSLLFSISVLESPYPCDCKDIDSPQPLPPYLISLPSYLPFLLKLLNHFLKVSRGQYSVNQSQRHFHQECIFAFLFNSQRNSWISAKIKGHCDQPNILSRFIRLRMTWRDGKMWLLFQSHILWRPSLWTCKNSGMPTLFPLSLFFQFPLRWNC